MSQAVNPVDWFLGVVREAVRTSGRAQVSIAGDLGISQKHMSEFMNDRDDMSLDLLRRLCDLLGLEWGAR